MLQNDLLELHVALAKEIKKNLKIVVFPNFEGVNDKMCFFFRAKKNP